MSVKKYEDLQARRCEFEPACPEYYSRYELRFMMFVLGN